MKVLQLIQTRQNRGAETFACQLSNHLLEQGHEVKIVSIYDGDAELGFLGDIINLGASFKNRFYDFKAWKSLASIVKSYQPDVVQANAGDTLKYAVFSKILFQWKAPIIIRNASEVGRYIHSVPQKILNAFLYRNVDQVISVSKASEKDILSMFSFLKGKTSVVAVGLEKVENIDHITLVPPNKKHIVHVGGFTFEKNHLGLLQIFKILRARRNDLHLHLIGDGHLRKEIERKAEQLDMQGNITFYGFVNSPLKFIKAADVLILPSIIEGLPGVILEAMYCKTPVVAYDVGGVGEIVTSKTGTLIPVNREEQFADATRESLENPSKHQIERAYEMVLNNFMNNYISHQFIKAYQKAKPSR